MIKRGIDIILSAAGLLLLAPVLLAVAAAVRLGSPGPILFRQVRVGRHGRPFVILKFRTMVPAAEGSGPQITAGRDPRVTRTGAILRRYKLDELPQLFNVLTGDMSLVGPRPEVPRYVALYTPAQQQVLAVRPGVTDPASLQYRHEAEILDAAGDPERHYIEVVMPDKLRLNLEYLQQASLWQDLKILVRTALSCLRG